MSDGCSCVPSAASNVLENIGLDAVFSSCTLSILLERCARLETNDRTLLFFVACGTIAGRATGQTRVQPIIRAGASAAYLSRKVESRIT